MPEYLKSSQVAEELGITVTSLYKLGNTSDSKRKLEPVNPTTYKGDGGYVYKREDVERIKPAYIRKDLTSAEAAKRIGRSTTYVHKLLREGLPYYEGQLRGKKTYFIKEADLGKYLSDKPDNGKYDMIYDKNTGVFLFQPFHNSRKLARIVRIKRIDGRKKEITLQISRDEFLSYEQAIKEGWVPAIHITDKKPITSYGYARFDFPLPSTLDSLIYGIIEEFFKQIGAPNIRISSGERLLVDVKKSVLIGILPTTHPDLINNLKTFLQKGEIIPKYDGTLLETGLSPITFYLPEHSKAKLIQRAEENNQTLQEWLEEHLTQH